MSRGFGPTPPILRVRSNLGRRNARIGEAPPAPLKGSPLARLHGPTKRRSISQFLTSGQTRAGAGARSTGSKDKLKDPEQHEADVREVCQTYADAPGPIADLMAPPSVFAGILNMADLGL